MLVTRAISLITVTITITGTIIITITVIVIPMTLISTISGIIDLFLVLLVLF